MLAPSSPSRKNILLPFFGNMCFPHERGAGCDGRGRRVRRARLFADGEAVWFWRPYAGVKFAGTPTRRADDGVNKAIGPRGERGRNRKTIAWGMPDVSGASAVNTGVHTHYQYAHTRLRVHRAPGIPRALFNEGVEIPGTARARRAARSRYAVARYAVESRAVGF